MAAGQPPPSPDGLPVLGNGLAFSRDPFGSLAEWATLGPVVEISVPGQSLYLVTQPDLVREVLVERADAFTISAGQRETFSDVEDNAVTGTTGERWRRLRRALQPAFTADRIGDYGGAIAEGTATHVADWDGFLPDFHREMRLLTVRLLGETLLGVDMTGEEAVVLDAADALIARSDPRRPGQLLPDWVPTPTDRRFRRRIGALDAYVDAVLAGESGDGHDVRTVLQQAHEDGDITAAELKDNLVGVMLAGHDSSAVTLTYAWYELSRHPTLLERVRAEIDEACGRELPGTADREALSLTRAVVDETLRLYPPAWATPREATEPVELGGYAVPAGAQVMCSQWVLHRDERFWDDPETFDPDRWLAGASRPEYAYFPFSAGPRHCIGMRFARLELTLALATMAQRVTPEVTPDGDLGFQPALTLRPTVNFEATVRPR